MKAYEPGNEKACQLEKELAEKEEQLHTSYCQLGKTLLELVESEGKEINALVDEIIAIRKRLAIVRKESQCPDCGALNGAQNRFCGRCGARLPVEIEERITL